MIVAPSKFVAYAVVDLSNGKGNPTLLAAELTRAAAREWIKQHGEGNSALRVRRAKLTLFES